MRLFRLNPRDYPININRFFSNSIFAFQRSDNYGKQQTSKMAKITERSNSADITCLEDIEPPFGKFLSGKYKRSFAYKTIKDRLPVILTRTLDTLTRNKEEITKTYGSEAAEEIKQVIGAISKLKNELVTNKPLLPLQLIPDRVNDDAPIWNEKIESLSNEANEPQAWYNTIWLICECYMYRRLAQEILLTTYLKLYDPFEIQKKESYFNALSSMDHLTQHLLKLISSQNDNSQEIQENVINLIKLALWGNRCDLSLSAGVVGSQNENPLNSLASLDNEILVDNTKEIWELLKKNLESGNENTIIDIVLDNSGYELFTDLCLASYLIEKKFTSKMRFYVKRYPWFISDVTTNDFHWFIKEMTKSEIKNIKSFGELCQKYLKDGVWTIEEESFWTEPFDFSEMKHVNPSLYNKISESFLVIFKGDLNYRKLMGDINWAYTTDFLEALRGFRPTNLVSLRTIKADVCCGLPSGYTESIKIEDPNWMETGRFGLIQATIQLS